MTRDDPEPVYWCKDCDRLWQLLFDATFERGLRAYDPGAGKVSSTVDAVVPRDWEGEPQVVGIRPEHWSEVQGSNRTVVMHLLESGNRVVLVDEHGKPTQELALADGEVKPTPLR